MSDPAFFGYGSLVNLATHDYVDPRPATLYGWRRVWRKTTLRDAAFLSVERDPDSHIDGVIATVRGGSWAALDAREAAYAKVDVTAALGAAHTTVVYRVIDSLTTERGGHILLSYLDVVVQGLLRMHGPQGVARFFASTHGWDTPVRDDRAAPQYPRSQTLRAAEVALVDACLATRVQMPE